MKEIAFLVLYFLTYSSAFAGVAVCVFARLKGGPRWLTLYLGWLLSSIAFMMIRNGGYFMKQFLGFAAIESTLPFYVLYMVTTALFIGFLTFNSLYLALPGRKRLTAVLTGISVCIPLFFIPLLFALGWSSTDPSLRVNLVNAMMYYSFVAVDAVLLFLFLSLKRLRDHFAKAIIRADLYAGLTYVVSSVVQWFTYYDEPYSLDPFCVVNVSLFVMFLASTLVIGREYLIHDRTAGDSSGSGRHEQSGLSSAYGEFSEKECRIVSMIRLGATNLEIADSLGMNLSAVKSTIYRIFNRYGVTSRAALLHVLESREASPDTALEPDRNLNNRQPVH